MDCVMAVQNWISSAWVFESQDKQALTGLLHNCSTVSLLSDILPQNDCALEFLRLRSPDRILCISSEGSEASFSLKSMISCMVLRVFSSRLSALHHDISHVTSWYVDLSLFERDHGCVICKLKKLNRVTVRSAVIGKEGLEHGREPRALQSTGAEEEGIRTMVANPDILFSVGQKICGSSSRQMEGH